jgi:hypothetical protein
MPPPSLLSLRGVESRPYCRELRSAVIDSAVLIRNPSSGAAGNDRLLAKVRARLLERDIIFK